MDRDSTGNLTVKFEWGPCCRYACSFPVYSRHQNKKRACTAYPSPTTPGHCPTSPTSTSPHLWSLHSMPKINNSSNSNNNSSNNSNSSLLVVAPAICRLPRPTTSHGGHSRLRQGRCADSRQVPPALWSCLPKWGKLAWSQ